MYPDLAHELFAYQDQISNYNYKYFPAETWLRYNSAFRLAQATNKALPWNCTDEYAFNKFFRCVPATAATPPPRVQCFRCKGYGHISTNCPNQPFRVPATQNPKPCPVFNRTGTCSNPTCVRNQAHFCGKSDVGGHTLEKIALTLDKHFNPIPQTIHTPVNVDRLEVELRGHPDMLFVNNLIHNMTWGFNIGYHGPCRSRVCRNLR